MSFAVIKDIFNEGRDAYLHGKRSDENPYTPGLNLTSAGMSHQAAYELWRFGWIDEAMADAAYHR